ncbi:abscisic acid 8-hydroxylase 4-like [Prunus yedoensis var. nudiflora]|uniref:Abscisic acid 8-hydroxylase 4-like n=1 Tax=Prunus yedoensis var. nudiflora TaxID=2094558 RepID=A0A314YMK4_PRUYE|nr:abscisic acid 8-hydroxylase 4-like [Prunus yedoensis var. nudiflora]
MCQGPSGWSGSHSSTFHVCFLHHRLKSPRGSADVMPKSDEFCRRRCPSATVTAFDNEIDVAFQYGEVFKTHILGSPCVMLSSPEAVRFVLVTQAHLFKPTYPQSKEKLIGPSALFFHQNDYHAQIRRLVQSSLSLDVTRNLVPDIEAIAISLLDSWSGKVVNTFYELKKFTFDVAVLFVFGHLNNHHHKEVLKENYYKLDKGYNSFPTNLPGSSYNKSVSARRRLSLIVSEIIKEREEKSLVQRDLLGSLLNFKDEKGQTLTHNQIVDNIIGVMFAAQDTTASLLTWMIKYIHDDSSTEKLSRLSRRPFLSQMMEETVP